jgi:hypothetical protein
MSAIIIQKIRFRSIDALMRAALHGLALMLDRRPRVVY